jgi:hypothetical protein
MCEQFVLCGVATRFPCRLLFPTINVLYFDSLLSLHFAWILSQCMHDLAFFVWNVWCILLFRNDRGINLRIHELNVIVCY